LPPWKDPDAYELTKLILENVGREGDHDRENKGIITSGPTGVFDQKFVDELKKRRLFNENVVPEWLIMTCDPNGGGQSSDTSIMTCYYHQGKMIICGTHRDVRCQSFIEIQV
jgi:hypothetical protein